MKHVTHVTCCVSAARCCDTMIGPGLSLCLRIHKDSIPKCQSDQVLQCHLESMLLCKQLHMMTGRRGGKELSRG